MAKNHNSLIECDLQHHFHQCSQIKDFEQFPQFSINNAKKIKQKGAKEVISLNIPSVLHLVFRRKLGCNFCSFEP